MTVRHSTGTLDVVDGNVVAHMGGTRGVFKKEKWQKSEVLPIKRLVSVKKLTDNNGDVRLGFQRKYGDLPIGFTHCREPEDIMALLETLSEHIVVEADGVVWQAFRADIHAGGSYPSLITQSTMGPVIPFNCNNCGAPYRGAKNGQCRHCGAQLIDPRQLGR